MKLLKKICTTAIVMTLCAATPAIAQEWKNDLRTQFLNNKAVIMEINLRSFNADDVDGDGFIQIPIDYNDLVSG